MIKVTTKLAPPVEVTGSPRVVRVKGHPGVEAALTVTPKGPSAITMSLDGDRMPELQMMVNKALNCWSEAPKWMFDLADALDARVPPE